MDRIRIANNDTSKAEVTSAQKAELSGRIARIEGKLGRIESYKQTSAYKVLRFVSFGLMPFIQSLVVKSSKSSLEKLKAQVSDIIERKYPPTGSSDKVIVRNRMTIPCAKNHTCFQDNEIVKIHQVTRDDKLSSEKLEVFRDDNGKVLFQQQARNGCVIASTYMLIADHGGKIDYGELYHARLTNYKKSVKAIKKELNSTAKVFDLNIDKKLSLKTKQNNSNVLKFLKAKIAEGGSILLGINYPGMGSHQVILDEVYEDLNVRIRDPYHGWSITVKGDAFYNALSPTEMIQIDN